MIELKSERLIIRNAKLDDVKDIYELVNSEFVMKYNVMEKETIDVTAITVESNIHDDKTFYLEMKSSKHVIGVVTLARDSLRYGVNSLMLEYYLGEAYARQGYMSEALKCLIDYAFNTLNVDIVSARAFKDNIASINLLNKLGFVHEGTLRRCVRGHGGIVYDDMLFSLMKEEYMVINK